MAAPLAAAGITALGGLAEGIIAGIGGGQERKWTEKQIAEARKWEEKMRAGQWKHEGLLRGELEKRMAPTTGYIGMSPALQGDVTRMIMGQAQRYLGEDVMKKYGIDVGGYFSGEKLAQPEFPYMYREGNQGGTSGARTTREDEQRFIRDRISR